jgi:dTDP-D-glucose 4,6-dehydratase
MAAAGLCEALCKPFGIEPPLHRRRIDFFTKNRAFSTAKAQRDLGYAPQFDLDRGLKRTFEWYREAGWL